MYKIFINMKNNFLDRFQGLDEHLFFFLQPFEIPEIPYFSSLIDIAKIYIPYFSSLIDIAKIYIPYFSSLIDIAKIYMIRIAQYIYNIAVTLLRLGTVFG